MEQPPHPVGTAERRVRGFELEVQRKGTGNTAPRPRVAPPDKATAAHVPPLPPKRQVPSARDTECAP